MTEASVQPIYLDTNFFIAAVEGTPETAAPARNLLRNLRTKAGLGVTSELTIAVLLAPASRADALPLHLKRRVYLDLLVWNRFINLVPVSRDILIETSDLRAIRRLRLPDAIHLVSAIQSRCRFFVSADSHFSQLPTGMIRIELNSSEMAQLVAGMS